MNPEFCFADNVVVCISTFKRRDHLARLLGGVSEQDYPNLVGVLVADNDAENPTMGTIDIPTNLSKWLTWFTVKERGVAVVRNRLTEFALQNFPNAMWLAFIDDDEVPSPSWLTHLMKTAARYPSDLVGGPVVGSLPESASILARRSIYALSSTQTTGPVEMLIGAGNLLISAKFLRRLERSPFLEEFGRTGGEDYEFFRYAKSNGAQFSWSHDAIVWENVESHRLTTAALLKRYLAVSAYHARIDRRYLNGSERVNYLLGRLRWLGAATVRSAGGIDTKKNFAEAMLAGAATLGYIIGLCGLRIKLY